MPPGSVASCSSTANSCGRTISGVLCTGSSGGICEMGTCDAQGSCGCDELNPNSCSGEQICVAQRCENAFPRIYLVAIGQAHLADRNPNGACWDEPGCGAPDPLVAIFVDGMNVG